ncbi:MAG TPA: type II CAAX endopeptidase family protein [Rhizomicrobium sp.]|nr:type II CAAX endopeptidase family protein [Rhizomicrobium sp.]
MTTFVSEPPRSAWQVWPLRLLVFFVVLAAIDIGCMIGPAWLTHSIGKHADPTVVVISCAVGIVLLPIAYSLLVRWTEQRRAGELLAANAVPLLFAGVAIGVALFCTVYVALFLYGAATLNGFGTMSKLPVALATAAFAAVGEELVFRGTIYRLLEKGFGTLVAIILAGGLFGALHAFNPGATIVSSLAIAFEAGVLLAAAYVVTRSLWLPIGLHFGWNFTEGGIFGASVSGGHAHGLLNTTFSGPALITGGAFGPEASIVAVTICVIAALAMLGIAARRGEWKPLSLRWRA